VRLVVKSDARQTRKAMAEPKPPPSPQAEQPEVSAFDSSGLVESFEIIRSKLILFFEVKRCVDPEGLADETLMRVFKKLCSSGEEVTDLTAYSFGFARNVFLEYLRKKDVVSLEFMDEQQYQFEMQANDDDNDAAMREKKMACLEQCLARLKKDDREMLLKYYEISGSLKTEHRLKMAQERNISRSTLSMRIFHLKEKLRKRVSDLLEDV
jgi:RNA polymerase sigma factor (sigma-70 family)